jgi:hypothetical protein
MARLKIVQRPQPVLPALTRELVIGGRGAEAHFTEGIVALFAEFVAADVGG